MLAARSISALFLFATLVAIGATGCNRAKQPSQSKEVAPTSTAHEEHEHDSWWCDEHGVPEGVCGLCSAKLAAELKAKGDWCREHDRPDSQCFICHPEKEAEFAAVYEAKYGKLPPKPTTNGDATDPDHAHDHNHGDKQSS